MWHWLLALQRDGGVSAEGSEACVRPYACVREHIPFLKCLDSNSCQEPIKSWCEPWLGSVMDLWFSVHLFPSLRREPQFTSLPLHLAGLNRCMWLGDSASILRLPATPRGSLASEGSMEGPIITTRRSNRARGMPQVAEREFRFVPRQILRVAIQGFVVHFSLAGSTGIIL